MKTVSIMMGIQGSGKTTFCRQFLPAIRRVNLDSLKTRVRERSVISECHGSGADYVIDNTNPTREDRARYIVPAKAEGYHIVGYFMQSRLQECIARNALRLGKDRVPTKAIAATSNRLELPSREEGFDELYFVENSGTTMTVSEWRDENAF